MTLCKTCGKESGLIRVADYGGRRVCQKCGRRLWKTGYYKSYDRLTEEERKSYEKKQKDNSN